MSSYQSYILCGTPRSGSTLLCGLLESARCGRPHSYFRRQSIPDFARAWGVSDGEDFATAAFSRKYLDAVLANGRGGTEIFGLRVMYETLGELSARLGTLFPDVETAPARIETAFGPTLYVHLSREDKVAQAVSLAKAEQTGLWHIAADGSELERSAPHREATYDRQAIGALAAELNVQDDAWREWFGAHQIEPVRLTYGGLSRDPQAGLRAVLSGLGKDPSQASSVLPRTAKLADRQSQDWIARFRAENR